MAIHIYKSQHLLKDQEFKVILHCIASAKPAWATSDPVSK